MTCFRILLAANLIAAMTLPAAADLQVGQAQAVVPLTDAGQMDRSQVAATVASAYQAALAQFGQGTPELILIIENIGRSEPILQTHAELGRGAPLWGVGTGHYGVIGREGFLDSNDARKAITVLAVGGDVEVQTGIVTDYVMPVKDWELAGHAEETGQSEDALRDAEHQRHRQWGRDLAEQFEPVAGASNVFLQLGTQHVPRMGWTHEGVVDVLGQGVWTVGGAGADHGYVYADGRVVRNAIIGVMLSGQFRVAMAGSMGVPEARTAETLGDRLQAVIDELGEDPALTFYFGCAGWQKQLDAQRDVAEAMLEDRPLFGSFCGGEIGRYASATAQTAAPGHLMLLGLTPGEPNPPAPARPAGRTLRVGQAQAPLEADEEGRLNMARMPQTLEAVYREAMAQFGEGEPKLVLVYTDVPAGVARGIRFVHQQLGRGAPLYGVVTGYYSVIGHGQFCGEHEPSISVLVLGGDIDVQVATVTGYEMPVKNWQFGDHAAETGQDEDQLRAASRARHVQWGRDLAEQFEPVAGATNVFLQLGTQHVPRMTWSHEGVIEVFGDDVYVVGGAAADHGAIIDEGEIVPHALLGVMISGEFDVALAGSPEVPDNRTAYTFRDRLARVIDELDGVPDLTIYFGCACWRDQFDAQHQVAAELLGDAPLFGAFAGGEIGRLSTRGEPIAVPGHLMLLGMRDRPSLPPTGGGDRGASTTAPPAEGPVQLDQSTPQALIGSLLRARAAGDTAAMLACFEPAIRPAFAAVIEGFDPLGEARAILAEAMISRYGQERTDELLAELGPDPAAAAMMPLGAVDASVLEQLEYDIDGQAGHVMIQNALLARLVKQDSRWFVATPEGVSAEQLNMTLQMANVVMAAVGNAYVDVAEGVAAGEIAADDFTGALSEARMQAMQEVMMGPGGPGGR